MVFLNYQKMIYGGSMQDFSEFHCLIMFFYPVIISKISSFFFFEKMAFQNVNHFSLEIETHVIKILV